MDNSCFEYRKGEILIDNAEVLAEVQITKNALSREISYRIKNKPLNAGLSVKVCSLEDEEVMRIPS